MSHRQYDSGDASKPLGRHKITRAPGAHEARSLARQEHEMQDRGATSQDSLERRGRSSVQEQVYNYDRIAPAVCRLGASKFRIGSTLFRMVREPAKQASEQLLQPMLRHRRAYSRRAFISFFIT